MRPNQSPERRPRFGYGIGLLGLLASLPYCATGSNLSVDPGSTAESSGGDTYTQGGDGSTPQPASGGSPVTPTGGSGPSEGGSPSMGGAPETGGTATGGTAPTCTECPSGCVDLTSDEANCGACDNPCTAPNDTCYSGTCAPGCSGGDNVQRCNDTCVDIASSDFNCGGCDIACGGGKTCTAKTCTCPAGLNDCAGTCVNLGTDIAHCGTCDKDCAGSPCLAGHCCMAPMADCSGTCADLGTDNAHCGNCETACPADQGCSSGTCVTGTGGTGSGGASGTGGSTTEGGPCSPATEQPTKDCTAFNTTGPYCMKTSANIAGWGCSNFTGRTVAVNNVEVSCGATLPAKWSDGYYYFNVTSGDGSLAWACIYWW